MLRLRYIVFLLLLGLCGCIEAQELKVDVTINAAQIEGSNKQIFETLKGQIAEFLNSTQFTTTTYRESERIECSMLIVVNSLSTDGLFNCDMTLQTRRPVFGSSYTTTVMNFRDNSFNFIYQEYDRLDYNSTQYTTNLVALLAFYAYVIIGEDADTFAPLGGTPAYDAARQVLSYCQTAQMEAAEYKGWKAHESNRSRYALISNLTDEAFRGYRQYVYDYHRLGLDRMSENVSLGRAKIAEGMPALQQAYRARPATYVINTFLDAKNDELQQLFSQGTDAEKKSVLAILNAIDPTRDYQF